MEALHRRPEVAAVLAAGGPAPAGLSEKGGSMIPAPRPQGGLALGLSSFPSLTEAKP